MEHYQKARTDVQAVASSSSFFKRAISTFTLGPLALYLIYLGGWYYFIPLAFVVTLAAVEYARMVAHLNWRLPLAILVPAVLLQLIAAQWPALNLSLPALALSLLAAAMYALWLYEKAPQGVVTAEWAAMVAGILVLGWMGGHFFLLRGVNEAAASWTILTMVGTWVADSAAYVFGTRFGKHKMAPRLSPNKSWEGYFSGVIVGTAFTLLLAYFLDLALPVALLIGLLTSVVSPAGDLAISLIKREAGVKDSGKMLPGHGGALDRIDSLLWSVTMAYYVVHFLLA